MINLYNQDCLEAMKEMPDNAYDLAIVDPPYGSNLCALETDKTVSKNQATKRNKYHQFDNIKPSVEYFKQLERVSTKQIIWGVNFFNHYIFGSGRIVWDKKGTAFGRAELAYYSGSQSVNIVEYMWNGMMQGSRLDGARQEGNKSLNEKRIHPTQKPVALYEWSLMNYAKQGDKILDTHGGSMSIAIACHNLKYNLDLYEMDKDYFEAGKKRLEQHKLQLTMFDQ